MEQYQASLTIYVKFALPYTLFLSHWYWLKTWGELVLVAQKFLLYRNIQKKLLLFFHCLVSYSSSYHGEDLSVVICRSLKRSSQFVLPDHSISLLSFMAVTVRSPILAGWKIIGRYRTVICPTYIGEPTLKSKKPHRLMHYVFSKSWHGLSLPAYMRDLTSKSMSFSPVLLHFLCFCSIRP